MKADRASWFLDRLGRIKSHLEQGHSTSLWRLVRQLGGRSKSSRVLQVLGVDAAPPLAWQQRFLGEFGGAGVILSAEAFQAEVDACPPLRGLVSPLPCLACAHWRGGVGDAALGRASRAPQ